MAMLAVAGAWAPGAMAQSAGAEQRDTSMWGVGIGAASVQKAYRDMDRDVTALPLISYESKWISVSVPKADLKLFSGDSVSLRLRARYAGDGYEADDSPFLTGMDERKSSVWLGGAVIWTNSIANLSAELLGDASSHSKGSRIKLQADRRFAAGSFGITPRIATEWVDRKYVNYYYGVRASEVRTGRSFYEGDSTANAEIGVRMDYSPVSRQTLFLDLAATRFGSAIRNSPLVDRSGQTAVSVGYLYRF